MDLKFSPEDEAFRLEARAWLEENVPEHVRKRANLRTHVSRADRVPFYRALRKKGWYGVQWPKEFGGAGMPLSRQVVLQEEMRRANAPTLDGGIGQVGPLIIQYGTPEQQKRFLPPILEGEESWCQGYSEPGAGSDLASLATRAELHDGEFVLNGQKVWTSTAHEADWMYILVRTDQTAEKRQAGISFLLMDMKSPGITISPIHQITGEHDFCEVFLNDVHVPRENLLGELNGGWGMAKRLLEYERLGSYGNYPLERTIGRLIETARKPDSTGRCALDASTIRQRLAQVSIESRATVYLGYRSLTKMLRGGAPGPESAAIKLSASEIMQRITQIGMDVLGPTSQIWQDPSFSEDDNVWPMFEVSSRQLTIARGTSEIQRNIISERVLGLPR